MQTRLGRMMSMLRAGLCVVLTVIGVAAAAMQNDPPPSVDAADDLRRAGNFKEAAAAYRHIIRADETSATTAVQAMKGLDQCRRRLDEWYAVDADLSFVVQRFAEDHRVLTRAADDLAASIHQGVIADGVFYRGFERGYAGQGGSAGTRVLVSHQDWKQVVRWRRAALESAQAPASRATAATLGRLHLDLAESLLDGRTGGYAWQLTGLTDLAQPLDYLDIDGDPYPVTRFAPVTDAGQPLLYAVPDSWEAAQSDGERLRWALHQAEQFAGTRWAARMLWGNFLNSQFSVNSLADYPGLFWGNPQSEQENRTYALHTLTETETLAKLASGIARFELPDEHNPIRVYQTIAREPDAVERADATWQLVQIFLDRRQYPQAAAQLEFYLEHFKDDRRQSKRELLASIREPRVAFDSLPSSLAGRPAEVSLLFRNTTALNFRARRVDLERLLADTKAYFRNMPLGRRSGFGGRRGRPVPNLDAPTNLFSGQRIDGYLTGPATTWETAVEPRPNHWDKRVQLETPLSQAGLYVVDVDASGGPTTPGKHTARYLLWIQDAALVSQPLDRRSLFCLTDAATGRPIAGANIEFFGWGHRDRTAGENNIKTSNFAVLSDQAGLANVDLDEQLQWLTIARSRDGKLAILNFERFWQPERSPQSYAQLKVYGVSDRPVYRPGEPIRAKFWASRVGYGDERPTRVQGQRLKVAVHDAQGNRLSEQMLVTDDFGGCEFETTLDNSAALGRYYFTCQQADTGSSYQCNLAFRVEEYRKPEFEVNISGAEQPVALGSTIQARIEADYYFGTPVAQAEVYVKVERATYRDAYFPRDPFDWCYGPGYWWFARDYSWYPGWQTWQGCQAPGDWGGGPFWRNEPPELVFEQELTLDANGEAVVNIDTALAKQLYGEEDHEYTLTVEVRDASRRTITTIGKVIAARRPFKVYSWLARGFYRVGDKIEATFQARTLDGTAVAAKGQLDLLKIEYDAEARPSERVVASFDVATNAEGELQQLLQADQPGQYRLRVRLRDAAQQEVEGGYLFTVRGAGGRGTEFRYSGLELVPEHRHYAPGDTVRLLVTAERDDAQVYLFVRPEGGVYERPRLLELTDKSTVVELSVTADDQPNFFVEAFTIYDGKFHHDVQEIYVPPASQELQVAIETDKLEYLPGEQAKVKLTVRDLEGQPVVGSCAIAAYDRALEQIAGDVLPADIRQFFWQWTRTHHAQHSQSLQKPSLPVQIDGVPSFNFLGSFGHTLADDLDAWEGQLGELTAAAADRRRQGRFPQVLGRGFDQFGSDLNSDMGGYGFGGEAGGMGGMLEMAMAAPLDSGKAAGLRAPEAPPPSVLVRQEFADSALWLAQVVTNADGQATAEFRMPDNLTSWQLRSWAVAAGTRVGSADARATTRKPLLVRLQTPRFLVEQDRVVLSAIVNNDLPAEQAVEVSLEIDGQTQLAVLDAEQQRQTVSVAAFGEARIDWDCRATAEGTVTLRAMAQSRTTQSASDAMQLKLPIVVHGLLRTDALAGTVRSDQPSSRVEFEVPQERRAEQSRLTVRLSPSLAAAMMDALPYLAEYPYGCTEQTLNRFLPTVITQQTLRAMQVDLAALAMQRRNNLNAQELGDPQARRAQWQRFDRQAVFDVEIVDAMATAGVRRLSDMQLADGGWGWFSGAMEHSGAHTTATVVRGLLIAQANGVAIVPDVLQRGVQWLENYQNQELLKLKNAETQTEPYKRHPNQVDALVLHTLTLAGRPNPEMQQVLYDQRQHLSVYGKALLAWATHQSDDPQKTDMLRRNIEQFLVEDAENETAFIDDDTDWWYWYGSEIEATAMYLKLLSAVDPQGTTAPRLVKFLLNNRKHASYWKSTRDTALVVEAFADFLLASGETTGEQTAEVWLSGQRVGQVRFTPENLFAVENTVELTGHALPDGPQVLEIRRSGQGNLYWNAYVTHFTLEREIEPAGLELKIERRYYLLEPEPKELLLPDKQAGAHTGQRSGARRIAIDEVQAIPSGAMIEVELLVQSKNDYEYLLIEDRKPAGLESVETQSGYFYSAGLSLYRELRDQHVGLFIRQLPKGNYSIRYQLRSEAPGTFTALPATIIGMYAPELVGSSADFDLQVDE